MLSGQVSKAGRCPDPPGAEPLDLNPFLHEWVLRAPALAGHTPRRWRGVEAEPWPSFLKPPETPASAFP